MAVLQLPVSLLYNFTVYPVVLFLKTNLGSVVHWQQCCRAEIIYFWLRLHSFPFNFGSGSTISLPILAPASLFHFLFWLQLQPYIANWEQIQFDNIKTVLEKTEKQYHKKYFSVVVEITVVCYRQRRRWRSFSFLKHFHY